MLAQLFFTLHRCNVKPPRRVVEGLFVVTPLKCQVMHSNDGYGLEKPGVKQ